MTLKKFILLLKTERGKRIRETSRQIIFANENIRQTLAFVRFEKLQKIAKHSKHHRSLQDSRIWQNEAWWRNPWRFRSTSYVLLPQPHPGKLKLHWDKTFFVVPKCYSMTRHMSEVQRHQSISEIEFRVPINHHRSP